MHQDDPAVNTSGEANQSDNLPVADFCSKSLNATLGLCKTNPGSAEPAQLQRWIDFITGVMLAAKADNEPAESTSIPSIQNSAAGWRRISQRAVFPFYIESISVATNVKPEDGESLAITRQFPGTWIIAESALDPDSDDYFEKHRDEWMEWVRSKIARPGFTGGLAVNLLEVPGDALRAGELDVRPLSMHALGEDGRATDRGDAESQEAIANAFWQTFWATGATRADRGNVFPVAFFPVDRSSKYEFAEPFHERYVSLRKRLFGRSAIVGYTLEVLTKARALVFCCDSLLFKVTMGFDPKTAETTAADVILALKELNRTGFIDAYTGANAEQFAAWAEKERQGNPGEPWVYSTDGAPGKIKAAGHGIADPLQAVRADESGSGCVRVHRVVPFAGCAFLNQVMQETDALKASGKIQEPGGELLAGTNSTFFLNFPEEYSAFHSAMNEPVAMLVEDGQTRQIRTFRRAAFILTESGEAFITTRTGNHLQSDVLVFEGESASTNYFEKSDKSFRENKFGPLFFGAVVVGDSIVETFEDIATEVPPAGWLTGDSEAFGGRISPSNVARVQVRRPGVLREEAVRHAFAVGPLLVDDGQIVPLGDSREEFRSLKLSGTPKFEETSELSRTELPDVMLDSPERGVPPTRFPYDWNVTRAPRSAIGVKPDGSVMIAVVDGRADIGHSVGATLSELATIMVGLGCRQAMNMDGGGSSVMFVNDEKATASKVRPEMRDGIVSLPSDLGGNERLIPVPLVVVRRQK